MDLPAPKRTAPLPKHRFVFLTLQNYSLIALSSAVEALRMANRVAEQDVYEWTLASLDGKPTPASNGLSMSPTVAIEDIGPANIMFVCGGVNVEQTVTPELIAALRRFAQRLVPLGSLCTGGYALAKAGLLDKYKAVVHWENMSALEEQFPAVQFSKQVYAIDRDRFTCSGGIAPLDLMLNIIKNHLGRDIAPQISDQFILDRIRSDQDRQHVPLLARVGLFHENLIEAAALMEANLEEPLTTDELARLTGQSRRQLERLFKQHLDALPSRHYLELRLNRSRELLQRTGQSILQAGLACGFSSGPHFSNAYKAAFGCTPREERAREASRLDAGRGEGGATISREVRAA